MGISKRLIDLAAGAGLVLTLALMSLPAQATVITATYASSANFGSGGVGYETGKIAPNPKYTDTLISVGIGGDSFTTTNTSFAFSSTGQFNAWCVDIYHWLSGGNVNYQVETGADLAGTLATLRSGDPTGTQRVADLVELANEVYSTVNTKVESAAFQLAVWAITYGSTDASGHYAVGTSDSNFKVDSATATSTWGQLANSWLDNLGSAPHTGPSWDLTYLSDGSAENTQDMIVFTDAPVPEPGTLALLGLGLTATALGLGRRRRA